MARVFSSNYGSANLLTSVRCSYSTCYMPIVVKMGRDQSYWASIESEIEVHLKKALSIRPPESVFEPMHYLTFTTPKSIAPALCVAACELVGGERAQAMAAASAIHLMHVATYTHNHMHGSGPTIDHKFGPNIELLMGDGIMPFAIELLAKDMSPAQENSDKILRVITEVTRAVGSQGLLEGQFRAVEWTQSGNGDEEMLEYVCKKKEGEIHACGAACGAILGEGNDEEVESLRNYGLYVGIIQGMINGVGRNSYNIRAEKRVEELRIMAMKELQTRFKGKKVRAIASVVEECFVPRSQCDLV